MNGFGSSVGDWLIAVRAIHFAATAMTAGILIFRIGVAEPALRSARQAAQIFDMKALRIVWICLLVSVASGIAWIGGLASLALLLVVTLRRQADGWTWLVQDATRRFSTLGIVSVATLLMSGIANAGILVGSLHALLVTDYGRLLIVKITLFVAMLALA